MRIPTILRTGAVSLAVFGLSIPAGAQSFSTDIFTDNFLTAITPPGETTNLATNIGSEGGRQGGGIVTQINPAGFTYSVYGQTNFTTGNGWDLRAQENWPAAEPIDTHTLRFRNDMVNWSTVSPNLGFVNNGTPFQIENLNYRIQVQVTHAHPDPDRLNDRWAGLSFGQQPDVRFPAFAANGGVIIYPSGDFQVFANGGAAGGGTATVTPNGAYHLDLKVTEGIGTLRVNGELLAESLDLTEVTPAWIGLTGFSENNVLVFASAQFRFDNFIISTLGPDTINYDTWAAGIWEEPSEGITGRWDDPDGDGLVNFLEYALARDPLSPDRTDLVDVSTPSEAGGGFAITYRQRADMEDAAVFPQKSSDLITWVPATAAEVDTHFDLAEGAVDPDGIWEEIIATDRDEAATIGRRFYRLWVEEIEP